MLFMEKINSTAQCIFQMHCTIYDKPFHLYIVHIPFRMTQYLFMLLYHLYPPLICVMNTYNVSANHVKLTCRYMHPNLNLYIKVKNTHELCITSILKCRQTLQVSHFDNVWLCFDNHLIVWTSFYNPVVSTCPCFLDYFHDFCMSSSESGNKFNLNLKGYVNGCYTSQGLKWLHSKWP